MIDKATGRCFRKLTHTRKMSWLEWKYWQVLRKLSVELDFYIRKHKPVELSRRVAIVPTGMWWVWEDTGEIFHRG